MRGLDKSPQGLVVRAIAGFPPVAENGTKAALTTGLTTDRKIFIFTPRRGIMAEIEYPGVAKLVSRLIWVQETGRSSRPTRTKIPLKSTISEGFFYSLSIAAHMVRWIRIHCARLLSLFSIAIVFQSTCINIILLNLLSNGSIIFINMGRCIPSAISGREEGSAL